MVAEFIIFSILVPFSITVYHLITIVDKPIKFSGFENYRILFL